MQVVVNGRTEDVDEGSTVADVVRRFRLAPSQVAVEVNAELVPRARYGERVLAAGDRIEIVTFVGGGSA